jgi:hypothetical protein
MSLKELGSNASQNNLNGEIVEHPEEPNEQPDEPSIPEGFFVL